MMAFYKNLFVYFAIIFLTFEYTSAANILGLFTSHSQSHLIVHMSVAKALAARGHNVTVITGMKPKIRADNVNVMTILPSEEGAQKLEGFISELSSKETSPLKMISTAVSGGLTVMIDLQQEILETEQFKKFYNNPNNKFDLVIIGYFLNDFQLGIANKFNCPVVVSWSGPPIELVNAYIGNPNEIAYVPNIHLSAKNGVPLTFVQRLQNMVASLPMSAVGLLLDYHNKKFYSKYFGNEKNFLPIEEMRKNISLLLVNNHFSEGPIRPNVPALIEVGGIQVKDKPDPLPNDIAEFLNNSKKNGAIYFCLGTNLKMSTMEPAKLKAIFNTLAGMKQNVIVKWNDMQNVPVKAKNIIFRDWLPQDDILAHPNIKLFITHAGKGGLVEAEYHGVPMLAIPFFADQHSNAAKMVSAGYGLKMLISELTEETFKVALVEVLDNPKYAQNIKQFATLYRDRPLSARENAVFWLEYVIRHHGAPHMQSPLVHLNFVQRTSLDTISFILLVLYILFRVIKLIFMFCIRKIKSLFTKSNKTNNKKKRQ